MSVSPDSDARGDPTERAAAACGALPRARVDRSEASLLLALLGVAASVLVPLLSVGLPLSGAYGIYAEDQLQYFAWIRDASHHILIGDRFDLAPGQRTFVHPVFTLSGIVHAATGLPVPLSYLLWEPVAIGLLFVGFLRYARRLLPPGGSQKTAVSLALFSISPLFMLVGRTGWTTPEFVATSADLAREVWVAGYLWGYLMGAITVALMPLVLLCLEWWRDHPRRRTLWMMCTVALLISWLHPWQGATLVIVLAAVEALRLRRTRTGPPPGLLLVFVAFALPALYYLALSTMDPVWSTYRRQNALVDRPWGPMVLALLPLAAPALLAYRLPARHWQEQAVRAWPFAAILVYVLPVGAYPAHAFDGVTLPLAILAVQGVTSLWPRPPITAIVSAVVLLTVPGTADSLKVLATKARSGEHGYFITQSEKRALAALERDRRPGGVLSPVSPGAFIPYTTGREVYVGHDSWTPNFHERSDRAEDLFAGRLTGEAAQAFVRSTRARFLFADCRHPLDLAATLRPLLAAVTKHGCATIYELLEQPGMAEAAGPPDW